MKPLLELLQDNRADEIVRKNNTERSDKDLKYLSYRIKKDIAIMIHAAKSGHPGGSIGLSDIYSVLFFSILNDTDWDFKNNNRNRVLISNGHVSPVRYAAMARAGIIPLEELLQFRHLGSRLQGHPSTVYLPEVENSSGSLGQGLSNAGGLALSLRLQNNKSKIFLGMSDGELQEGMSWEAAMAVCHHKIDNLFPFVDRNDIQIDGRTSTVMNLNDLRAKFQSFGWDVIEGKGNDIPSIRESFHKSMENPRKPVIILFHTVLGSEISFMENNPKWHGVAPSEADLEKILSEIDQKIGQI